MTEEETASALTGRRRAIGWWSPTGSSPELRADTWPGALQHLRRPVYVVDLDGRPGLAQDGVATLDPGAAPPTDAYPLLGFAPALAPEQVGDPAFRTAHGLRYAYIAGAMANGISSVELVEAMGRAGMIGFFGAAGLDLAAVEAAIGQLQSRLGDQPYGFNLIHSPDDPGLESSVVDLYLRRGVRLVSASAYLGLTLPLIRYRVTGVHQTPDGQVVTPNNVIAKVSRVEVARKFLSPPPEEMLAELVRSAAITEEQARLAGAVPVAEDLTAEADSAGHTDNRPALTLLPTMLALRDELQARFGYACRLRVGAAGGIATPESAAAAFAMGAAYILTGSINQACREAGTCETVRRMLAEAGQADVVMAPAADMFELGVQVQVLKRGTMFAIRARKLYELYRNYHTISELPAAQRRTLERDFYHCTLEEAWEQTRSFFAARDAEQIARAERDPQHKLALVFRSYLGQASNWANSGAPSRQIDFQIWCGPAMGAFNEWVRGTFLEAPERRDVVTVALNLLVGAAAVTRAGWLRAQGVALPPTAERFAPRERAALAALMSEEPSETGS